MQKNKKYLLTMLTFVFVIACTFFFQKDVKAAEKTGTVTFLQISAFRQNRLSTAGNCAIMDAVLISLPIETT